QLGKNVAQRLLRRLAGLHLFRDQVSDDLGIGLALERAPPGHQRVAQRLEVLDDAIVYESELVGGVWMGVMRGWGAVSRPARVRNTDRAGSGIALEFEHQVGQFALGAAADKFFSVQGADPGAVVAAIFHTLEAID